MDTQATRQVTLLSDLPHDACKSSSNQQRSKHTFYYFTKPATKQVMNPEMETDRSCLSPKKPKSAVEVRMEMTKKKSGVLCREWAWRPANSRSF
ncbi:hypothetical protein ILYODFUR_002015 [Ilyodon furcidens]|uniref:Uncharacterized protein n=1 Tax=Ilyodon furcidens TaxID=33524 RepID=A0ABV0VCT7_9TELE